MFSLIALGIGTAYLYSLAATFAPGLFPRNLRRDGVIPVYYEAAAVITVLVLLGQILELRAREQTGDAIRALLNLAPKTARRIRADGGDEDVPLEMIQVGDRLRVRPGDRVPVDGAVIEGRSAIDETMVTGESMPVEKAPRAQAIGGTINGTGSLVMRAEKVGSDTMLARIVQMVAEAQPCADSTARRYRLGMVRAGGHRRRRRIIHRLDDLRTATGFRLCARSRRVSPHHRLSLRARPRHSDVDHGRRGQGGERWRPYQKCRGAGAFRKDRHAGCRQDRNVDRRQAARGCSYPCGAFR